MVFRTGDNWNDRCIFMMIDQSPKLSVTRQCELLELTRTGVYHTSGVRTIVRSILSHYYFVERLPEPAYETARCAASLG